MQRTPSHIILILILILLTALTGCAESRMETGIYGNTLFGTAATTTTSAYRYQVWQETTHNDRLIVWVNTGSAFDNTWEARAYDVCTGQVLLPKQGWTTLPVMTTIADRGKDRLCDQ